MKLVFLLVGVIFSIAIAYATSGRTNAIQKIYVFSASNINSETIGEIVYSDYIRAPLSGKVRGYSIAYRYNVHGKDFVSNLINFSHIPSGTEREYANHYPVGKVVNVYYSSETPKFSILERKTPSFMVFFQAAACIFISIFFGFVISSVIYIFILEKHEKK